MSVSEQKIVLPFDQTQKGLIEYFKQSFKFRLDPDDIPIRFAVTAYDEQGYVCEIGTLQEKSSYGDLEIPSIFDFRHRNTEDVNSFKRFSNGSEADLTLRLMTYLVKS